MDRQTLSPQPASGRSATKPLSSPPAVEHGYQPAVEPAKRPAAPSPATQVDPRYSYHQAPSGKSHLWVWLIILVVLTVGGYFVATKVIAKLHAQQAATTAKVKVQNVPVVAEPVVRGDLDQYLDYQPGTVTPYNTVPVRSRVDGQIMKIYFKEGDIVKENQPLFDIDSRPFEVQLTQAEGQYARDEALLRDAKLDLQRYESLLATAAIAQQQIDTQKALVDQYEGTLKADQGQMDSASLNIAYCHITAPITGKIGLQQVFVGTLVHAADTTAMVTISQLQPITVLFPIAQKDIQSVFDQPNNGIGLTVEAWTQDKSKKLATGKLFATDSQVDPTTQTLKAKASFDNQDYALFPSEGVDAKLLVDTLKNVLMVSHAAVQPGSDFTYAFVVKPDNTVEMRQITTGPAEGDKIVIESGLSPGEMVVTDNVDKLTDGTSVKVRPPAAPKAAGAKGAATQSATTRGSNSTSGKGGLSGQHRHNGQSNSAAGDASPTTKEAAE